VVVKAKVCHRHTGPPHGHDVAEMAKLVGQSVCVGAVVGEDVEDGREGEADCYSRDVGSDGECVLGCQVGGKSRPERVEIEGEGEEEESGEEMGPDVGWGSAKRSGG